tara:strand:- start:4 stop:381 length:378 start_codon:yes stop_codon:yes gene_type:complete
MSLLDKKSLYDRQSRGALGNSIGTPDNPGTTPKDGNYYAEEGQNMNSPFTSKGGPVDDHMVALLTKNIISKNTNTLYMSSPNASPYQDLHPGATDTWSGQPFSDTSDLKQFGGPYKETGPIDGQY